MGTKLVTISPVKLTYGINKGSELYDQEKIDRTTFAFRKIFDLELVFNLV
jgi:hypothetical protein